MPEDAHPQGLRSHMVFNTNLWVTKEQLMKVGCRS